MKKVAGNSEVDAFFLKPRQWQDEFKKLRTIILGCRLAEELKWRWPCYTLDGHNVVLIHGFKDHCAVLFFKGALLKDAENILVRPGENTQAGRQMRFTSMRQIAGRERILKAYVQEAIAVEQAGLKVKLKKSTHLELPGELQDKLNESADLKTAFEGLTPGRRRAYVLYFSGAKQSKTREARVEKCVPQILAGKGLND
jgi:uncharacterized protein YdeI (YjbR/CyaY-like superfamily)